MPDADVHRRVLPEALVEVIAFLASDGAGEINGAASPVVGVVRNLWCRGAIPWLMLKG
jgi:hypothetical protein